jgi:hypothetical protein
MGEGAGEDEGRGRGRCQGQNVLSTDNFQPVENWMKPRQNAWTEAAGWDLDEISAFILLSPGWKSRPKSGELTPYHDLLDI